MTIPSTLDVASALLVGLIKYSLNSSLGYINTSQVKRVPPICSPTLEVIRKHINSSVLMWKNKQSHSMVKSRFTSVLIWNLVHKSENKSSNDVTPTCEHSVLFYLVTLTMKGCNSALLMPAAYPVRFPQHSSNIRTPATRPAPVLIAEPNWTPFSTS